MKKTTRVMGLSFLLSVFLTNASLAVDSACVVISIEGSGSLKRSGTGVRSSIKKGDTIYEKDEASLSYGAKISLAFDDAGMDVMYFQGPSTLRFITPTQIEITKGKASVILNNVRSFRNFKIKTPSAIASGRGAHFQVEVKQTESEVRSYKSKVEVFGINKKGLEMMPATVVEAGRKTKVTTSGKRPEGVVALDTRDIREIGVVKGMTSRAMDWVGRQKTTWLKTRFERPPEDLPSSSATEPFEGDADGTHYLF